MSNALSPLSLFLVVVLPACGPTPVGTDDDGHAAVDGGPSTDGGHDGGGPTIPPGEFIDAAPEEICDQMDILFVIDNSGSMAEEQSNLAANFPMFIDVIDTFMAANGNEIAYRVAVTSTGLTKEWVIEVVGTGASAGWQSGDDGMMLQRCGMPRRWLEKDDTGVSDTFSCAAELGINGPGLEMPLAATRAAFEARIADGTNVGFRRDGALLAVVIVTDEDDCSRQEDDFWVTTPVVPTPEQRASLLCEDLSPVTDYKAFLDSYSGGEGRWATAVIAGPGPGACESEFGNAAEATRLRQFVDLAGTNGVFSSICEGDLSNALLDALTTFNSACQTLPPPVD